MQPQHFASLTDALFKLEDDGHGGVKMIPRPHMDVAINRELKRMRFRDAATPPMNNLHRAGGSAGGWDRLPGRSRDQGAGQSEGTQGSAGGGTPRRPDRPPKPAAVKAGAFTVDQPPHHEKPGTGQQYKHPSIDQEEDPDDIGLGEKVEEFEDPGPGLILQLEPMENGSIVVQVSEDTGETLDQNSAMTRHSLGDNANARFIRRMNGINRRHWARTRDDTLGPTRRATIYRHRPLAKGERLQLQGPNEWGTYDLVLFSGTSDLTGPVPPGASGGRQAANPGTMKPTQTWSAAAGARPGELDIHELSDPIRTGDRAPVMTLARMNQLHRQHWARSA
jgi:hypothetical protein